MKKSIIPITVLVLALCSCTKEDSLAEQPGLASRMTFAATVDASGTKTSLGEENTVIWDEEDAISVFDFNSTPTNSKCTLTDGAGTENATFEGDAVKSDKGYFALYPYCDSFISFNGASSDYPKGLLTFLNVNYSTQYARKGNLPSNIPMVAYADAPAEGSEVALNFKNVFSYLKFTLEYKCKSVTISSNSDEYLTPSAYTISFDGAGNPVTSVLVNAISTVTLKNEDGSALMPGTYYVAVLPQTLSEGLTMTFASATKDGVTYEKPSRACTLERAKIYNLGTIDLTDLVDLAGSGTEDDPYLISDYTDLMLMQMRIDNKISGYSSAYYKQTQDIDCEGKTLLPIGSPDVYFSGTYDGGEHTIRNAIYEHDTFNEFEVSALFAAIKNATIMNLNVGKVRLVYNLNHGNDIVSPLVGFAMSEDGENIISNCHISDTENGLWEMNDVESYVYYGGLVAYNESRLIVQDCSHDINVKFTSAYTSSYEVGGIVGFTEGENSTFDGSLDNSEFTFILSCRNTGAITINDRLCSMEVCFFGGILGHAIDYTTDDDVTCRIGGCVNSGTLSLLNVDYSYRVLGGLVGFMESDGSGSNDPIIEGCLNKGELVTNGCKYLGGIMGFCQNDYTKVMYCVNTGKMSEKAGHAIYGSYIDSIPECKYCFTTVSCYDNSGCEVKTDLTAEYMNVLLDGSPLPAWRTNSDGTLDLDF